MGVKDFRVFAAKLSSLTPAQRRALMAARITAAQHEERTTPAITRGDPW